MENQVKISIIVPIYNSCNEIRKCLEKLVRQSLNEIEIILINDGSTDSSQEICKEYAKKYSNIVYISQGNQGVSVARNMGIQSAKGTYIMFCDSDDYYEENAAELLYRATDEEKYDFVIGGVEKLLYGREEFVNSGEIKCDNSNTKKNLIVTMTKNFMINQLWGKLYRRDIIERYSLKMREDMSCGEDLEWICRFMQYTDKITSTTAVTYHYIINKNDSLSQCFNKNYFRNIENQFFSIKELYVHEQMWKDSGDIVINQQIYNIINGYLKVLQSNGILENTKDKINYIQEGINLESRKECLKLSNKSIKNIFLRIKNPNLILVLCKVFKMLSVVGK